MCVCGGGEREREEITTLTLLAHMLSPWKLDLTCTIKVYTCSKLNSADKLSRAEYSQVVADIITSTGQFT